MTTKDNILQELNELQSSLSLDQQNPYTVPVGYFDTLTSTVLARIKAMQALTAKEELLVLSPILSGLSKQMPFQVPAGYFDGLVNKHFQSLDNIEQPANEELAGLSPLLSGLNKKMPYATPAGYFEGLSYNNQETKINIEQTADEELAGLSPLLSGLKKEMPYAVPAGYFETLSQPAITEKVSLGAKVIPLGHRKWFRYAAAAVVFGIIAMTTYLFIHKTDNDPGSSALAAVSKDVKKMNETQKDDLIEFIDAGITGEETVKVNTTVNDEVKNLLKDISDEELKDFQEQTEDVQDVLLTN